MMIDLKPCPECGVPEYISHEHLWLNSGDIVQAREPWHRLLFMESENMEPLFRSIEEMVGASVEDIIMNAMREAISFYMKLFIPEEIRELVLKKRIDPRPLGTVTADMAKMAGFGNCEVVGARYEQDRDDFITMRITEPAYLPMVVASMVASARVLHSCEQEANVEEVSPGAYEVTLRPSRQEEPSRISRRFTRYQRSEGDLEMEKCAACGVPLTVSEYSWDMDQGFILNSRTGRRMCIMSPQELEPIFQELEKEFGETILQVVVEAQRRFTKSGFYSIQDLTDHGDFRVQLALRGLGNVKEIDAGRKGMHLRVDNAAMPLIIVGLVQGLFEMGFDVESEVEWGLSQDDRLEVEIVSRG